jgi:hypothetical protein
MLALYSYPELFGVADNNPIGDSDTIIGHLNRAQLRTARSRRMAANGLNVVAVRIEDKCPVVVRMIVRPKPWLAVVARARADSRCVKAVDGGGIRNRKSPWTPVMADGFRPIQKKAFLSAPYPKDSAPSEYRRSMPIAFRVLS